MSKKEINRKAKKQKVEEEVVINRKLPGIGYIACAIVAIIFALSLYIRAVLPHDTVFLNNIVAFAADDSVYHMRLVENTIRYFPNRIAFDPYTYYPLGSYLHWGPLFDQMIAFLAIIAGLITQGTMMPSEKLITTVGAYFPAVLGALVVLPVYFIGKTLAGRGAGLLSALLIAILPGQFLNRSLLGFTDNHIAEALFSTATIMFYMLALKSARDNDIRFDHFRNRQWDVLRKPFVYSILAGSMYAAYQLSWPGASFFGFIIVIFAIIMYISEHLRKKSTDYLALTGIPMFAASIVLVFPYINTVEGLAPFFLSWFHVLVPLAIIAIFIVLSILSKEINKRGYEPYYYPVGLAGIGIISMIGMEIIAPTVYSLIINTPKLIFEIHTGGPATVAEGSSIFERTGYFWANFPISGMLDLFKTDMSALALIIIVLAVTGYKVVTRWRPEELLFLIWGIVMLLAVYGQNRWAYYFAVNVALMVGLLGVWVSEGIIKFGELHKLYRKPDILRNINPIHILSVILIGLVLVNLVYPAFKITYLGENGKIGEPQGEARWGSGAQMGYFDWYDSLNWMRYNTPDPGLPYFGNYGEPTSQTRYKYPESTYGVMSWWDYGHIITYFAHRIPNANPFQAGIGGGQDKLPGASTFLTAQSEQEANKILDELGTNGKPGARYVVTDVEMTTGPYPRLDNSKFSAIITWTLDPDIYGDFEKSYYSFIRDSQGQMSDEQGQRFSIIPGKKYYNSMEARLHILDADSLSHYRMVHESGQGYDAATRYRYNQFYGGNLSIENTGYVKVFEYVKGANITGKAAPFETVTVTNTIKTNLGRPFTYAQKAVSDEKGMYEFIVPYSTTGPITPAQGGTMFDTAPTGPYTIEYGNTTRQVSVSEEDVMNGRVVKVE